MFANSREVTSNQTGPHDKLLETVEKHRSHAFQRPIHQRSHDTFNALYALLSASERPIILDSCNGTGDSTRYLGKTFPNHWVVGIDKSAVRAQKSGVDTIRSGEGATVENYLEVVGQQIFVHGDVIDLWRLLADSDLSIEQHYILYPNPYPKSTQLGNRWHGHAVFPALIAIGGDITLRSNWQLYLEEFALALNAYDRNSELAKLQIDQPMTAFERKFSASGQALYELKAPA